MHLQLLTMHPLGFDLNEMLGFVVNKTGRAMHRNLERAFAEGGFDIGIEHWIIIVLLLHQDGLTQQEISDRTFKDKTSLARVLDTMEKKGFVVRINDQEDRRQKRIHITRKAREMRNKIVPIIQQLHVQASQRISAQEIETCKRVLRQMYQNLEGSELRFPTNNM